ncbi:hypothetical protein MMC18_008075 [Xylographa bjoerkii]|nr:hypothetical protein [Xylographa bjoerkii]
MPTSQNKEGKRKAIIRQQPTPSTQDELSDGDGPSNHGEAMEKDETELELEKLVFGDDAGFREGLKLYRNDTADSIEDGSEGDVAVGSVEEVEDGDLDAVDDADLFFIDSGPSINPNQDLIIAPQTEDTEGETDGAEPPAWIDSDDERITVSLASNPRLRKLRISETEDVVNGKEYTRRLRQQFERLYPVPEWANPSASRKTSSRRKRRKLFNAASSSSESNSDDEMSIDSDALSAQPLAKLLQSTAPLTQTSLTSSSTRKKLRPEVIDIQRTKDVSSVQPSAITSLSFHPQHPLLLSSGPSSTLTLHHISPHAPTPNPTLTSLHIHSHPLTTSAFLPPGGARIFFSARRRYFHIWDLASGSITKVSRIYGHAHEQRTMERFKLSPDGRWLGLIGSGRKGGGTINILDASTCQWVAQVRVEGKGGVADFAWWGDGAGLLVVGKGGEAVEYSMEERRVVARWTDEGAVGTTVVALGGKAKDSAGLGGDRWAVVGSQSGIVNIYDRGAWKAGAVPERPAPARALEQLTTPVSCVEVSPDGQMLVMASRWKRDALRLGECLLFCVPSGLDIQGVREVLVADKAVSGLRADLLMVGTVHLPSCTVYKNWPTANTPFGRITAVAIAPNSEMLAVANEQGKIRLWEIRS